MLLYFCPTLEFKMFRRYDLIGVNYDDDESVFACVHHAWWLEGETCKWMLAVLVHKVNPDVCSNPTAVAPGTTCALA